MVEVVSGSTQLAPVAHSRPDWQQPPPRLAGQVKNPEVQVRDVDVVGTTMIPVEDVELDVVVVEVEGCTYVTDVPTTTPILR